MRADLLLLQQQEPLFTSSTHGSTYGFLFIFPFELSPRTSHAPATTTTIRVDPSIDEPNLASPQ
jgi:hypothetical protein